MQNILYISQSPLQLVNNIEASLLLEKNRGKHIIFIRDKQSNQAIDLIIEEFRLKEFKKYKINKKLKIFFPFLLTKEKKVNYDKIYYGNTTSYTSYLINKIKPEELIHVDDGTRTLYLLGLNDKSKYFEKKLFKSLEKNYLKRSTFFTYYYKEAEQKGKKYIINNLSMAQKVIEQKSYLAQVNPAEKNQKIFIGTNILNDYDGIEKIFKKINDAIELKDSIYIMHRYDDSSKMKVLAEKYDFQAIKINLPIELYFKYLWKKNKPEIWTFGSTALDTLALICPDATFNVIKLNTDRFLKPGLGLAFENIYTHLENMKSVEFYSFENS